MRVAAGISRCSGGSCCVQRIGAIVMRKNRSGDILNYYLKQPSAVYSVKETAERFGISERQVRNYIRQINGKSAPAEMIQIDGKGVVKLAADHTEYLHLFKEQEYLPAERVSFILSRLLSERDGVNIFDLAETLFVSRPTIEADLAKVRKIISSFDITLEMNADVLKLSGAEKAFRRVTSYMITTTEYEGFLPGDKKVFVKEDYQVDLIRENLIRIFEECHFVYNDYSINNIILHLIITIDRIKHNYYIENQRVAVDKSSVESKAAQEITAFLAENFDVWFSELEAENLAAFLACNLATVDYRVVNPSGIEECLPEDCRGLAHLIIVKLTDYYYLPPFDDIFFARFLLHIDNLIKRLKSGFSAHNPLYEEIRHTYPFLYDTAIYAAEIIREETGYSINENEISLIALHIGSFIESSQMNRNKLSAIYVYTNYHEMYQRNVEALQTRFGDQLNLQYTISVLDYNKTPLSADIVISEVPLKGADAAGMAARTLTKGASAAGTSAAGTSAAGMSAASGSHVDVIQVSPFITKEQLRHIEDHIAEKMAQREKDSFTLSLQELFTPDIFFRDITGSDKYAVLASAGQELMDCGYIDEEFLEAVYNREKLSSTCFIDNLAIPHAISQNVKKSFISFTTYSHPISWDEKSVSLMVIIGISYAERKNFRTIFNQLVKLFENQTTIRTLAACETYEEVLKVLREGM